MLKKVVVVYPNPHAEAYMQDIVAVGASSSRMVYVGEKTFKGKDLEVVNTDAGNLIIKDTVQDKQAPSCSITNTLAVFKEWIYWENIE